MPSVISLATEIAVVLAGGDAVAERAGRSGMTRPGETGAASTVRLLDPGRH